MVAIPNFARTNRDVDPPRRTITSVVWLHEV
jgi:hypothetical protein